MATANPPPLSTAPRRRGWKRLIAWALLAAGILLAWFWKPLHGYGAAGASYGARVACACRHLGGRDLRDCRKDFLPEMALVTLSEDAEAKSVTARFPLLSSQTATFREGQGCVMEKWED